MMMIDAINKGWGWTGITAKEIIVHNDFGNIVFKSTEGEYWRVCPEELSHKKIAADGVGWVAVKSAPEFIQDWEMVNLVELAQSKLGALADGRKYFLIHPPVLGGAYEADNFGEIGFAELISVSGDMAEQVHFLEDGQRVRLTTTNQESSKLS